MKRSTYRAAGIVICAIMAALALHFVSRLNWMALPLGVAALLVAFMIGRASIWVGGLTVALLLIGCRSTMPYFVDFAASRILPLSAANLAGGSSLKGQYLLNSGFLSGSRRVVVIEGDSLALDDLQRRSAFYLPELSRGACRTDIARITSGVTVIDSRCEDAVGPDR